MATMPLAALAAATNVFPPPFSRLQPRVRAIATAIVVAILIRWVRGNYRAFLALGKGGLPVNPLGYCIAMMAIPFGKESTSTACYDRDNDKSRWLSDPDSIPERSGERPILGWHSIPQRQINCFPSQEVKEKLVAIFVKHATANIGIVDVTISPHERVHNSMVIAEPIPSPHEVADHALREIAHLHSQIDYSLHLVLSPQDCKLVIERGWGERHPLSGTKTLPKEYLFIYAPRDDEELGIVERILLASIAYMTGEREVH
ncbi:hypothetical protein J3R82DRAFT_11714 [Butyriboletus roseoflavus]|nr:hypothetical protein J3R82DRAFT_11714 [Butyriboletus roseoflavus]